MANAELTQKQLNGAMLRTMREAAELTLAELARRADVDPSHLSHYEAGRKDMEPDRLDRIHAALVERVTEPQ